MKKPSSEQSNSSEPIARARLQADVAKQRVRIAKDELKRARKRLKEAKREAKRARKLAAVARKAWKRARRASKDRSPNAVASPDGDRTPVRRKTVKRRSVRRPVRARTNAVVARRG